jgi:uncharacterized membrane protein YeaQ/YmgE (transglycosylase-associated protein family)
MGRGFSQFVKVQENPYPSVGVFPIDNCLFGRYIILNLTIGGENMLLNIILWIIFGALAGWIASMIMGRNAQMGALANIVVGIVGAIIGGFLMNAFGASGVTGFNITSLIVAIIGAIVLLFLIGLVRRAA